MIKYMYEGIKRIYTDIDEDINANTDKNKKTRKIKCPKDVNNTFKEGCDGCCNGMEKTRKYCREYVKHQKESESKTLYIISPVKNDHKKYYKINYNGLNEYMVEIGKNKDSIFIYKNYYDDTIFKNYRKDYWIFHKKMDNIGKIFFGKSPYNCLTKITCAYGKYYDGNTILVKMKGHKYVWICDDLFQFDTQNDEIIRFVSSIGPNDVPYPVAFGKINSYVLSSNVYIKNEDINKLYDTYVKMVDNPIIFNDYDLNSLYYETEKTKLKSYWHKYKCKKI